jgi:hypothetical protein
MAQSDPIKRRPLYNKKLKDQLYLMERQHNFA